MGAVAAYAKSAAVIVTLVHQWMASFFPYDAGGLAGPTLRRELGAGVDVLARASYLTLSSVLLAVLNQPQFGRIVLHNGPQRRTAAWLWQRINVATYLHAANASCNAVSAAEADVAGMPATC